MCAVNAWLSAVASDDSTAADSSRFEIMKQINEQLSIPQADQLAAQQLDLATFIPDEDTSITVDLSLDLGSAGGDKVVRRGVKMGASDVSGVVSDLTAEVDFEIGPDVSSECLLAPAAVLDTLFITLCALHCILSSWLSSTVVDISHVHPSTPPV